MVEYDVDENGIIVGFRISEGDTQFDVKVRDATPEDMKRSQNKNYKSRWDSLRSAVLKQEIGSARVYLFPDKRQCNLGRGALVKSFVEENKDKFTLVARTLPDNELLVSKLPPKKKDE